MKKGLKKLIAMVLTAAMALSVGGPAFAGEALSDEVISLEEFRTTIQLEGEKLGLNCDVQEDILPETITKDLLDKSISFIHSIGQPIEKEGNIETLMPTQSIKNLEITRSMPIQRTRSEVFYIRHTLGTARMLVEAKVTMDASNNYIITIDDYDVRRNGGESFLTDWYVRNISFSKNNPSYGYVTATIDLTVTFSGTDMGIPVGVTFDEHKIVEINFN